MCWCPKSIQTTHHRKVRDGLWQIIRKSNRSPILYHFLFCRKNSKSYSQTNLLAIAMAFRLPNKMAFRYNNRSIDLDPVRRPTVLRMFGNGNTYDQHSEPRMFGIMPAAAAFLLSFGTTTECTPNYDTELLCDKAAHIKCLMPGMKTLEAMRFVQFKEEDTRHNSSYRRAIERRCIKLKNQGFNYVIPSGGNRSLPVTVTTHGSLSPSACSALTEPTELEMSITKSITGSATKSITGSATGSAKESAKRRLS